MDYEFLQNLATKFYNWTITELPAVLIIIIVTLIALRLYKISIKKFVPSDGGTRVE